MWGTGLHFNIFPKPTWRNKKGLIIFTYVLKTEINALHHTEMDRSVSTNLIVEGHRESYVSESVY